jgi:hypothetical protein
MDKINDTLSPIFYEISIKNIMTYRNQDYAQYRNGLIMTYSYKYQAKSHLKSYSIIPLKIPKPDIKPESYYQTIAKNAANCKIIKKV